MKYSLKELIGQIEKPNLSQYKKEYATLLDTLSDRLPDTAIYVQSVLPVSAEREKMLHRHNATIQALNSEIKELSKVRGMTYIDLFPYFLQGDAMNPLYSPDGLHLSEEGYRLWWECIAPYISQP